MEGCRSPEALTQFGGLAFSFQMLMFIEALIMHQGHTQESGRRLSRLCCYASPRFLKDRESGCELGGSRGQSPSCG